MKGILYIWIKIYTDFKYTYAKMITKICKFERQVDRFTP